jgi:hypothetical protein
MFLPLVTVWRNKVSPVPAFLVLLPPLLVAVLTFFVSALNVAVTQGPRAVRRDQSAWRIASGILSVSLHEIMSCGRQPGPDEEPISCSTSTS